jgi:PhnB protein
MATRLNPYISFGTDAREALTFYQQVLGGELTMNTFGEYGHAEGDDANLLMHGMLETEDGLTLMAADTPSFMEKRSGNNITISLSGDDAESLRRRFDGLSEGGTVETPLAKQVWGDEFGQLTDRFGIGWLVNIAGDTTP